MLKDGQRINFEWSVAAPEVQVWALSWSAGQPSKRLGPNGDFRSRNLEETIDGALDAIAKLAERNMEVE